MSSYVYVLDSMTNNEYNFLTVIENTLKDAKKFVIFNNALSYAPEPYYYNGCIIKLYELDSDENLKGEDTVVWRVELEVTQEKEFRFEISGYQLDEQYILKDINDNIIISFIGDSTYNNDMWFKTLVQLGIINDEGVELMSDSEYYEQFKDLEHFAVDKYELWSNNLDYNIKYYPDGGIY